MPKSLMRRAFRRDLELTTDPRFPGAFVLRRRAGARLASMAMILCGAAFTVIDLFLHRPLVAAFTGLAALLLGALHLQAEVVAWRFDGAQLVRRDLSLLRLRVREERLAAAQVDEVGFAESKGLARAWLVTQAGELHPLIEGKPAEVQKVADGLRNALWLARARRPEGKSLLH
jgi:hypothetical protein